MAKNDRKSPEPEPLWNEALVVRVGAAARQARGTRSAKWLSDRTAELGHPISAQVIARLDAGKRAGHLEVAELLVLAAALGIPPVLLLFPGVPGDGVEVLPGVSAASWDALRWTTGEAGPAATREQAEALDWRSDTQSLSLIREERVLWSMLDTEDILFKNAGGKLDAETLRTLADNRASAMLMIGRNRQAQRDRGMTCLPPRAGFESVDEMDVR